MGSSASRVLVAISMLIASSALGQQPRTAKNPPAVAMCGPISEQTLKCPEFGFTYKVPVGWVDRTDDMQDDTDAASVASEHAAKESEHAAKENDNPTKSRTLLAIFSRPPGAPGDTINSAVVIVAESLANYHGVKTPADYFGPITELAEQRGFKAESEPYFFSVGAKQLVRGDFSKDRGKLTMRQSSLVTIEKGYILSFTFVGGDEDEIESLISGLNSGRRISSAPKPQKK